MVRFLQTQALIISISTALYAHCIPCIGIRFIGIHTQITATATGYLCVQLLFIFPYLLRVFALPAAAILHLFSLFFLFSLVFFSLPTPWFSAAVSLRDLKWKFALEWNGKKKKRKRRGGRRKKEINKYVEQQVKKKVIKSFRFYHCLG